MTYLLNQLFFSKKGTQPKKVTTFFKLTTYIQNQNYTFYPNKKKKNLPPLQCLQ